MSSVHQPSAKRKTPNSTKCGLPENIQVVGRLPDEYGGHIVVAFSVRGQTWYACYAIDELLRNTTTLAKDLVKAGHIHLSRGKALRGMADIILELGCESTTVVLPKTGLAKIQINGIPYWVNTWDGRQYAFGPQPPVPVATMAAATPPSRTGTLTGWKKAIARHCHKNPHLIVILCHALAAPLRRVFRQVFLVLLLVGPSSTGKTTGQRLAASMYGSPENEVGVLQMSGTEVGIREQLESRNDLPLCFQDIRQSEAADVLFRLIFSAADGANRYTHGAHNRPLSATPILSNERSIMDLAHRGSSGLDEGLFGRCIELYANAKYGLFHDIHDAESASAFSKEIEAAAYAHHGKAWPAWLSLLSDNWDQVLAWYKAGLPIVRDRIAGSVDSASIGPVDGRMLDALAFSAWVGMVASKLGLLPLAESEIRMAFSEVFSEHIGRRQAGRTPLSEKIIADVRGYIDQHQGRFPSFDRFDTDGSRSGITGYRRQAKDGSEDFLFFPDQFEGLFAAKYGSTVYYHLRRAGFLRVTKGRGNQLQVRVPNMSGADDRKSFIAVNAAIRFDSQ